MMVLSPACFNGCGTILLTFQLFNRECNLIEQIHITNHRCFENLNVPLKPFTVLVGPNNTGKSSFLRALAGLEQFVGKTGQESEFFRFDREKESSINLTFRGHDFPLNRPLPHRSGKLEEELLETLPIRYFDIPKLALPMRSKGINSRLPISEIIPDNGTNVSALLDYMLRKERKAFFSLVDSLKVMIPGLEDIDIETPSAELRQVNLVLDDGFRMPASLASMGVRLMIFFTCLAYHPDPPKTILIEEPETGVHPKRLAAIVDLLRGISNGDTGFSPAQVIVSTHSPYLLDCINLDTDQVLVFQRESDGSRVANPMNANRLKKYMDEYMLGEFWFNGGEEVLLGS